ncbi:DnaJ/Hsp40 cysteine-rich domain superfamily protein [Hibiscus syriacus]|uniref:DnaJ/Hsp40 cysteine-rich domain superfamily protein n=1 Tax=Hibiscus syriacus TaxID=106335 RepID=A0A6A2XZG9_HIBSY|nr:DnaJ/Hsp40 cysteine-rich domain superfamily protein [Hibiscus syriacus]
MQTPSKTWSRNSPDPQHTDKLPVTLPGRLSSKTCSHGCDHPTAPRRPPFKLQERRKLQHSMKKLEIKLGLTTLRSESLFYSSSGTVSPSSPRVSEEEKAIAEKCFYLHPSTLNTPRGSRSPELLTLFPLSSPREEKRD